MAKKTAEHAIVSLSTRVHETSNTVRQLQRSVIALQRLLLQQNELTDATLKRGKARGSGVTKTVIKCGEDETGVFWECADTAADAKAAAEQEALKEYECDKNCMPLLSSTAKRTGLQCANFKPEWEVKVTITCYTPKK